MNPDELVKLLISLYNFLYNAPVMCYDSRITGWEVSV